MAMQVGLKKRINGEVIEVEINTRRPLLAKADITFDDQLRFRKLRFAAQMQLRTMRHRVDKVITRCFIIEIYISKMQVSVDIGLFQGTGGCCREVDRACNLYARMLHSSDFSNIKVRARSLALERMSCNVVPALSSNLRCTTYDCHVLKRCARSCH